MKPRLFDGEHLGPRHWQARHRRAAMKPRLFDGEHHTSYDLLGARGEPQ